MNTTDIPGYEIGGVLLSEEKIKARVKELGAQITRDYAGEKPLVIGTLKGAFIFMADLVREIDLDLEIDFISASSYGSGTESSGKITVRKEPDAEIEGRHVIIVEDIVDSGNTLKYLKDTYFTDKNAKSVKICALLDKPARRIVDITPDYTGFTVEDLFIVGCGLDYQERFRQLPHITYLVEKAEEQR